MFQIFRDDLKIPFMSFRTPFAVLSGVLILGSLYFLVTKGLNYGVDFAGGVQMVLGFPETSEVSAEDLRQELSGLQIDGISVQSFGTDAQSKEFIVHFAGDFADESSLRERLNSEFTDNPISEFRLSGLEKAYVSFTKNISLADVRAKIEKMNWGLLEFSEIALYGREGSNQFEIHFHNISERIVAQLDQRFAPGDEKVEIKKLDFVGAKVGGDLKTSALLSLIITTLLIFVYIFLRFDLNYAPGVVFSAVHDVVITAGVFAFMGLEFDLTIVAALMTLAGYSINDTIVIFDRIREMAKDLKGKKFQDLIDLAINQTLNRTVITSGTTFITTAILWIFGGPVISGFAFALCVGILVGTYSSIFVAAAFVLWTDQWRKKFAADGRKRVAA